MIKNRGIKSENARLLRALDEITATVDETGRAHGHWHGVAVKIARAARLRTIPDLSPKDIARIKANRPQLAENDTPAAQADLVIPITEQPQ